MGKHRVLVVDDSEVLRSVLLGQLAHLGVHGEAVDSGRDAIEKILQDHFDLVLMDIFMPDLDGIETTSRIREEQAKQGRKPTPIIAVSGGAEEENCLSNGLNDFAKKPLLLNDLRAVLNRWLPAPLEAVEIL